MKALILTDSQVQVAAICCMTRTELSALHVLSIQSPWQPCKVGPTVITSILQMRKLRVGEVKYLTPRSAKQVSVGAGTWTQTAGTRTCRPHHSVLLASGQV